jgi:hypothetical protein
MLTSNQNERYVTLESRLADLKAEHRNLSSEIERVDALALTGEQFAIRELPKLNLRRLGLELQMANTQTAIDA